MHVTRKNQITRYPFSLDPPTKKWQLPATSKTFDIWKWLSWQVENHQSAADKFLQRNKYQNSFIYSFFGSVLHKVLGLSKEARSWQVPPPSRPVTHTRTHTQCKIWSAVSNSSNLGKGFVENRKKNVWVRKRGGSPLRLEQKSLLKTKIGQHQKKIEN